MSVVQAFNATKDVLTETISQLCAWYEERGHQDFLRRAHALGEKLTAEQFNLVVLGQFKRGKSTLINALLGAEVLPTAVVPLTSVVTVIHYGRTPHAVVRFLDGRTQAVDLAKLPAWITELENPKNMKGVAQADVFFPAEILIGGVQLVDTPGVGSVFTGNTGTTHAYLPEADAAICVLAADQPISQAELEFLQTVQHYAAKFFFVLNKIDYLSPQELQESLVFSARVIAEQLASEVIIYPISARAALLARLASDARCLQASGLPAFEGALMEFLLRDKGTTLLASLRRRLQALVSETLNTIDLERAAMRLPATILADRIQAFHRKAAEILQKQHDTEYLLRGESRALLAALEGDLRQFVDAQVQPLTSRIREALKRHDHLGTSKLIQVLNHEMARAIVEIFAPWRAGEEGYVRVSFERITARFVGQANQIIAEIQRLATDLFDVQITPMIDVEPFTTESRHYYYTDDPFMLQLSRLPLLLPGRLARRYIHRQFLRTCREQLDMNAGRLRADFQARLEKSARAFSTTFNTQIQATLDGLEQALQRAAREQQRSETQLQAVQGRLEADRAAVVKILALVDESLAQTRAVP